MKRWLLVLGLLVACKTRAPPAEPSDFEETPPQPRSMLGTNLDFLNLFTTAWPFLDAMRTANTFQGGVTASDADGWPTALTSPASVALSALEGGEMILRWRGSGRVELRGEDGPIRVLTEAPHRRVFVAEPNQRLVLTIAKTDPKDHVRDVQIFAKRHEARMADERFHPRFVERLRAFGVLRFMDWGRTNSSPLVSWSQRTSPTYYTQATDRGAAYEHMIALANEVGADVWINVPHRADDDFVAALAELLAAEIPKERTVYVEYSNELWNEHPEARQSLYAKEQGLALRLAEEPDIARLRFQAERSVAIFTIFERAFGSTDRLVRVIGSQAGNHWAHAELLGWKDTKSHVDALAIAPYFGNDVGRAPLADEVTDVEVLMARLEATELPKTLAAIAASAAWAQQAGVALVAYEGGQHLVAEPARLDDEALDARLDAANRHPAMKRLYLTLLERWVDAGGKTFVHFNFAGAPQRYGRYGALESLDQARADAPKHDALMTFRERYPEGW